jgi:AraC-like DNA-binding protein
MLIETAERPASVVRHLIFGLNPLVQMLEERNLDIAPLLEVAKIPASQLKNPRYQLTSAQELRFTESAIDALNIPELGLEMGLRYHLSSYGMLGLTAMTRENLAEAFRVFFKYIQMTWTYMHFTLEADGKDALLRMEKRHDLGNCYHYMIERDMAAWFVLANEILGKPLPLRSVKFAHSPPKYASKYAELFNCDVEFDNETNSLTFDAQYLDTPLTQAAIETSIVYEQQCELISDYLEVEGSFTEKVRFHLIRAPQLNCNQEILAERMFTTRRSIQRKLAAEGTTFKALVEEIRRNLALEYLHRGDMLIEDIAERLGYSDAASFSHAFKRWTGTPPSATRISTSH